MSTKVQVSFQEDKIAEFCRRNQVRQLSLFGSVLREDFHPDSDIDVLVEFEPSAKHSIFDLLRMQDELGMILGRRGDLIEKAALRNPFRRHEILRTHQVIFGG